MKYRTSPFILYTKLWMLKRSVLEQSKHLILTLYDLLHTKEELLRTVNLGVIHYVAYSGSFA